MLTKQHRIYRRFIAPNTSQHQLDQKRHIWPLIGVGVVVIAASTLAEYALRAYRRMNNDQHSVGFDEKYQENKSTNDKAYGRSEENRSANPPYSYSTEEIESIIGLDIGSSNCRISVKHRSKVQVLENLEGGHSSPSYVLVGDNDSVIVGRYAFASRWTKPQNTISGATLLLGGIDLETDIDSMRTIQAKFVKKQSDDCNFIIDDRIFSCAEVNQHISRYLMAIALTKLDTTESIPTVASVPNFYSDERKKLLSTACRRAGFNCVALVPDAVNATIAAYEMALIQMVSGDAVAVVDVGGKFTQLSIISWSGTDTLPTLLFQKDLFAVGGEIFTDKIVGHINLQFARANGIDLMADKLSKQRLYDACESSKLDLSSNVKTKLNVPFITADRDGPKHLNVTLTRTQLTEILQPQLDMLEGGVNLLMASSSSTLAAILVVGASARMPLVRDALSNALTSSQRALKGDRGSPPPLIIPAQPEELVVIGAASVLRYTAS